MGWWDGFGPSFLAAGAPFTSAKLREIKAKLEAEKKAKEQEEEETYEQDVEFYRVLGPK